jgi:hypothetical protein
VNVGSIWTLSFKNIIVKLADICHLEHGSKYFDKDKVEMTSIIKKESVDHSTGIQSTTLHAGPHVSENIFQNHFK